MFQTITIPLFTSDGFDSTTRVRGVRIGDVLIHRWIDDPEWWSLTHALNCRLILVFSSAITHDRMIQAAQQIDALVKDMPPIENDQSWETDEFKAWYRLHRSEFRKICREVGL